MKDFDTVRCEVRNGVGTITLNRPEKRNALNLRMFGELAEAVELLGATEGVRVIVVRGEGPSFCAGIDVSELAGLASASADDVRSLATTAQRPSVALMASERPTVAVVHGHALGAGLQLAVACDLRVAAEDTSFGVLEIRFGLIPDLGGPHRLVSLVGSAAAMELMWTGRRVEGVEALRLGLVNRAVPLERLEEESNELVGSLAAVPPITVRLGKRLVESAQLQPFEDHLAAAREAQVACVASEDHREAVAAFLERREPKFAGR
jgi:enoyl-CoA hydratase/carnithine racemase